MSGFWHRIEPHGRDEDLEEGLQARVADPLWMLARQWQLGEFRGEDAASPIHVRATIQSHAVRTFRNDATPGAPVEDFTAGPPLECRVEAESVLDGPAAVALAAEAGRQFLHRLDAAGLTDLRTAVPWRTTFPLDPATDGIDTTHLPARARRRLELLARRGLDGRRLYAAPEASVRALVAAVDASRWGAVRAVLAAWRAEYADRFREPGEGGDTWVDERLEYAFSLGVPTDDGEVVLSAPDGYAGGHLDWSDFGVGAAAPHGLAPEAGERRTLERLPTPVAYRGQPAPRWWEFEDRRVYFGNLAAGPADLARLVVAEFGAVFSDDWYVVPITVDAGTLNRVVELEVIDVFGDVTRVEATAVNDHAAYGDARPWAFFELDGDDSAARGRAPWLFVPPALASSLNGRPVEEVTFVRDEAANLGWGIESRVELPTGGSVRRRQQWIAATTPAADEAETPETAGAWRYRLQSPVPPWWVPLVPERAAAGPDVRLRRGRLQGWDALDPALAGAKGRILGVPRPLRLYEEEVPRGGVHLTRAWQLTRSPDGRVHLWMARRKRPGRGDRASGLEFDRIERD